MIEQGISNFIKYQLKKRTLQLICTILNMFKIPIIIFTILCLLVCYITDILYIGIKNEDESGIKNELKYYTTAEYTEEDTKSFFESVGSFISGLFVEFVDNADWPVLDKSAKDITSYYGNREAPTQGASTFHNGIDIAAPEGTKLIAIMEGQVIKASWGGSGGFTITINSGDYTFSYCHCDPNFMVEVGETVKKGQVIRKSWTKICLQCT